ncbi:MAG: hypothetical protein CVV44_16790 [Spirochaetae bacterium HGW-Spirochaetae-1]|jgi:hypothetical protein|nr:MAG: hypothetical protein CVV44_16790 [Spirochaetae bacterium HGW-Spirochaetae-1]
MRKHPKKNDIYNAALGLITGDKLQEVLNHISSCQDCAKKYEAHLALIKPSDNSTVMPSEQVERRLIQSYRSMQKPVKRALPDRLRPLALGVAASIMFMFGIYFSLFRDGRDETIDITAVKISGSFMINETKAAQGAAIKAGSSLETARESRSEIGLQETFSIAMAPQSRLEVDEARYDRKSERKIFSFLLNRGTVYARFRHNESGLEYSFHTQQALIHSIGTQFLLQAEEKATTVLLTEGRLKITSMETGETIELTEGNRCVITSTMRTDAITEADRNEILALTREFENRAEHTGEQGKSIAPGDKQKSDEENIPPADDNQSENGDKPVDGNEPVPGNKQFRHNRELREMRREIRERRQSQRGNRQNQ